MDLEKRVEQLETTLREQQATIDAMDTHLEAMSAEFFGFKLAFMRLTPFLQMSERDVTAAQELAIAQAEDATEQAGMTPDTALIVLSTIRATMALAGELSRYKRGDPEGC